MRGADIVARSLERLGCRRIFTLSGNHIMSLFDATLETKIKLVHVRHEAAAVHMADGWGRLTGEPGVAMVTGGPGHVNTIGALFAALSSESPMVLLSGHAATREFGFQEPMRLDYRPIGVRPFFPKPTSSPRRSRPTPGTSYLSFIGSSRVGWYLRSKLPPGTRCALEHGGAAPAIIDRSADLDRLIEPLTKGGYYHAGQVCVSVQRIYVHADLESAFLDRFAARVAALKVGDPILLETEAGPLIHPREADRVLAWTDEAVSAGARLIGGGRLCSTTLVPSIIVNPPADAKVSTLEVFGPVTCVYPFTRLEDAIAAANSLPMAFQASIFTEDLRSAFDAAERLAASAVMVNEHTAFVTDWMPLAGRRQSGYGIGGIPWMMREMTEQKMIVFRM
jgi:hypothetical protein